MSTGAPIDRDDLGRTVPDEGERAAMGDTGAATIGGVPPPGGLEWHGDTDLSPDDPPFASSVRLARYQPARGPRRTVGASSPPRATRGHRIPQRVAPGIGSSAR